MIDKALMEFLGKEAASKTFRTRPSMPASEPTTGKSHAMNATHGTKKPSNVQLPHRLGQNIGEAKASL